MTAQNMGKKILTEAGYEVVAVSNGAAAVKKIAEQKPDIIILDVYMPGYSGLEVCEKVRSSIDTLKTPVLLTVGKMEPYKPEDANRVKADGVIIKPFEASDLLAIVKKLEERVGPASIPPLVQQTIRLERAPDFSEFAVHGSGSSSPAVAAAAPAPTAEGLDENTVQPTIDVPDHMATVSAFSDLLGTDMSAPVEFSVPVAARPAAVSPDPSSTFTAIPDIEVPAEAASAQQAVPAPSWDFPVTSHQDFAVTSAPAPEPIVEAEAPTVIEPVGTQAIELQTIAVAPPIAPPLPTIDEAPVQVPSLESSASFNPDGVYPDTQPIPVYEEPEGHVSAVELNGTRPDPAPVISPEAESGPEVSASNITASNITSSNSGVEFGLEPTIAEPAAVTPVSDPNLVSDSAALEAFPTTFGVENPEPVPVGIASDLPVFEMTPAAEQTIAESTEATQPATATDDDFEARVAAAMDLYEIEAEPVEAEVEQAQEAQSSQAEPVAPTVQDDFEARVAAAMSFYEEPQPAAAVDEIQPPAIEQTVEASLPAEPAPMVQEPIESVPAVHSQAGIASLEAEPVAEIPEPAEQPPSFEYSPPVTPPMVRQEAEIQTAPQPEAEPAIHAAAQQPEQVTPLREFEAQSEPAPLPMIPTVPEYVSYASSTPSVPEPQAPVREQIAASIESEMPVEAVAAAVASTGADHEVVAQVVHRVMERIKPELIAAIVKELNSQK
jgi:CheY-like chemotaxis protein